MCFDTFWVRLLEKKPDLAGPDATATLKSRQLKALLQQAYEAGRNNGENASDQQPSLFKAIFGR